MDTGWQSVTLGHGERHFENAGVYSNADPGIVASKFVAVVGVEAAIAAGTGGLGNAALRGGGTAIKAHRGLLAYEIAGGGVQVGGGAYKISQGDYVGGSLDILGGTMMSGGGIMNARAFGRSMKGTTASAGRATSIIPGDADFVGPVQKGWVLTPQGQGAHLVERSVVSGRKALSHLDLPETPRFYPTGTPGNAGAAHVRLHRATKQAGIKLRRGGNSQLSDTELLGRYRRAYSDASLDGILGDLRTPGGSTILGRNLSPAAALELLMRRER